MASVTTGEKWKRNTPVRSPVATCSCDNNNMTEFTGDCPCAPNDCPPTTEAEPHQSSTQGNARNWKETHGLPFSEGEDSCKKACDRKTGTCGFRDPSRRFAPSRLTRNPCLRKATPEARTGFDCNDRTTETSGARCTGELASGVTCSLGNRSATCPARQPRSTFRRCPVLRRPIPVKCLDAPERERPWTVTPAEKPVAKDVSSVKRPIKTSTRPSIVGSVTGRLAPPSKSKRTGFPVRTSVGDQRPISPFLSQKSSQRPKPDVGDGLGRRRLSPSPVRKREPLKPVPRPVVPQRSKLSEMKGRVTRLTRGGKVGDSPKGKVAKGGDGFASIFTKSTLDRLEESDTNDEELLVEVLLEPKSDLFEDVSPERDHPKTGGIPFRINDVAYDMRHHFLNVEGADEEDDHEKGKIKDGDTDLFNIVPSEVIDTSEPLVSDISGTSVPPVREVPSPFVVEADSHLEPMAPVFGGKEVTDVSENLNESEDNAKQVSGRVVLGTLLDDTDKDFCCVGGEPGEEPHESCISLQPSGDFCQRLIAVEPCDDTCVSVEPYQDRHRSLNSQKSCEESEFPIPVDSYEEACKPYTAEELCGNVRESPILKDSCGDVCELIASVEPCEKVCDSSSGEPCGDGYEAHLSPPLDFACTPVPECTVVTCTSVEPIRQISEKLNLKTEDLMKARALPSMSRKRDDQESSLKKESPEKIMTPSLANSLKAKTMEMTDSRRGSYITKRTEPQMTGMKELLGDGTTESTKLDRVGSPNARIELSKGAESPTRSESLRLPESSGRSQAQRSSGVQISDLPTRSESKGRPESTESELRHISPERAKSPEKLKSPEGHKSPERYKSPEGYKTPDRYRSPERYKLLEGCESPQSHKSPERLKSPERYNLRERYESPERYVPFERSESPKIYESPRYDSSKRSSRLSKRPESPRRSDASRRSGSPRRSDLRKRSETSKVEKEHRSYEPESPNLSRDEPCNYCKKCESVEREINNENLEKYSLQTEEVEEFMAEVPMGGDSLFPKKSTARLFAVVSDSFNAHVSTPDLELLWKAPSEYLDVSVNVSVSGHVVVEKDCIENVPELTVDTEPMEIVRVGTVEPILRSMGETATPSENMRVTDESLRRILGSPTSIASTARDSYKTARDDVSVPAESIKGILTEKPRVSHKKLSFAPLPVRSPLTNDTSEESPDVARLMVMETIQPAKISVQYEQKSSIVRREKRSRPVSGNRESSELEKLASTDAPTGTKLVSVKSNVRISDNTVCHEIKINFETPTDLSYAAPHPSYATSPSEVTHNVSGDEGKITRKEVFLQQRTLPRAQGTMIRESVVPESSSTVPLVREGSTLLTSLPEISCFTVDEKHETNESATDFDADKLSDNDAGERSSKYPLPEGIIHSPERRLPDRVDDFDATLISIDTKIPQNTSIEQVEGNLPPHTTTDFIRDILNFDLTNRATAKEEELTSESLAHLAELKVSRDSTTISSDTSLGKVTVVEIGEVNVCDNATRKDTLTSVRDGSVSSVEFDPAFLQRREHDVDTLPPPPVQDFRKAHVLGDDSDRFEKLKSIPPGVVPPIKEMRRTQIPAEVIDVVQKLTSMQSDVFPAIQAIRKRSIPGEVKDILEKLTTLEKNVDEFLSMSMNGIPEEVRPSEVDSVLPEKLIPAMVKYPDDATIPQDAGDVSEIKVTNPLPHEPSENTKPRPCMCFPDQDRRRDRKRKRPCLCQPSHQKPQNASTEVVEANTEVTDSEILFELRVYNPPKGFEDVKEEVKSTPATTVKRKGLVATKIAKSGGDDRKGSRRAVCVCGRDSSDSKTGGVRAQTLVTKTPRISIKKDIVTPQDPGDGKPKRKETVQRPPAVPKKKVPMRKARVPCIGKGGSSNNSPLIPNIFERKPCPDVERTTLFMIKRRELIPIASLPPEIDFAHKSALEKKEADTGSSRELHDEFDTVSQESRNVDNESSSLREIPKTTEIHKLKTTAASRPGDKAAGILASFVNEGQKLTESVSHASEELPWEDAVDTFSANLESVAKDKLREEIRKFVTSRFEDVNACGHIPEEITLGIHYYSDDSEDPVKKSIRESSSQVLSQIMEVERELESDSQVPSDGEESDASKRTYAIQLIREGKPSETVERTSKNSAPSKESKETKKIPVEEPKKKRPEVKPIWLSHVKENERAIERNRLKDLRPLEGRDVLNSIEARNVVDRVPGIEAGDKKETAPKRSPSRKSDKESVPLCVKVSRAGEARLRSTSPRNLLRRPPKKVDSQIKSTFSTESRSFHESRNKGKVPHLSPSRASSKTMHKQSSGDSKRKEKVILDPHEKLSLSFSSEDVKQRMSLRGETKLKESAQKNSFLSEDCVWEDAVESLSKSEMASKASKDADVFVPLRPIVVANDIVEFVTRFTTDQVREGLSISKIFSRLKEKMEQRKTADVAVFASGQSLVARTLNDAQTQTEPAVSKTVKILVEKSSEVSVRVREVSVDKLGRRKKSKELTASMARGREISYSASNARVTHVEERRVSSQKLVVGEHGVSSRSSTREDVVIRMVPARGAQKDTIEIWRHDRFSDPMGMEVEVSHVSYDPHVIRGRVPEEENQQITLERSLEAGETGFEVGSKIQQLTISEEQQQITLDRSVNDSFSQTPIGDGPFPLSGDGLFPKNYLNATSLDEHKPKHMAAEEKVEQPSLEATLEMGENQCIELEQSNIQQQTICLQQQKIQITSSVIQQQKIHTSRSPLRTKKKDSGEYHPGSRNSFPNQVSTVKLINLPPDICGCPLPADANKPVFDNLPIVILHDNTGSASLPFNRSVPGDMAFQADDSLKHVQATTTLRKSSNTFHDHIKQKRKFSSWDAMLEEAERRLSETEEKRRSGEISHEQAAKEFSNVARALRRSARKRIRNGDDDPKKKLSEEEEERGL